MKTVKFILALALVLITFGAVSAQDFYPAVFVNMDEVTGADAAGIIDPASLPATLVIPVRFVNIDRNRTAISNGYKFTGTATYESVTVAWNPEYPWDWMIAMAIGVFPPYFDQGLFINYFDETLFGPGSGITDTIGAGLAGLTGAQGSGLPPTFDGIAYHFTLTGITGEIGEYIRMDTTWWQPANFWLWTEVGGAVSWSGPYIFSIGEHMDVSVIDGAGIPNGFTLNQNYPNPFNPTTTVTFDVPRRSHVNIVVYNILGQPVKTLVSEELAAGSYTTEWNGTTEAGSQVSSGVYLCKMVAGDYHNTVKMMMLK